MATVTDLWAEFSHAGRLIPQAIRHRRTVARNLNQKQFKLTFGQRTTAPSPGSRGG